MTIPLMVLAFLAVFAGLLGIPEVIAPHSHLLERFLAPVLTGAGGVDAGGAGGIEAGGAGSHGLSVGTEWGLMAVSVLLALIGVFAAVSRFSKRPELEEPTGFGKILANKWYVDEFYTALIVRPLDLLSQFLVFFEKNVIDAIVNGVGRLVQYGSRQLRLMQSGQVGGYVLLMVAGIIVLFLVELFVKK